MIKWIKKTTVWLLVVCMFIGFLPVFASAVAAEEKPVQAVTLGDIADLPSGGEAKDWNPENLFVFLWDLLKAIGENLKALSADQVLNLPANAMDDVVTYIFSIFKLLGINMDSVYKMISSIFPFI